MQKKESITCVILSSDYSFGDLLGIISDSLGNMHLNSLLILLNA